MSFDDEDFDDDGDDDDDDNDGDEEGEDEEERDESNRSETSDDNEGGEVQNVEEEVTSATEDEDAGQDTAALSRNRMLDLEGWFLGELMLVVYDFSLYYSFFAPIFLLICVVGYDEFRVKMISN